MPILWTLVVIGRMCFQERAPQSTRLVHTKAEITVRGTLSTQRFRLGAGGALSWSRLDHHHRQQLTPCQTNISCYFSPNIENKPTDNTILTMFVIFQFAHLGTIIFCSKVSVHTWQKPSAQNHWHEFIFGTKHDRQLRVKAAFPVPHM